MIRRSAPKVVGVEQHLQIHARRNRRNFVQLAEVVVEAGPGGADEVGPLPKRNSGLGIHVLAGTGHNGLDGNRDRSEAGPFRRAIESQGLHGCRDLLARFGDHAAGHWTSAAASLKASPAAVIVSTDGASIRSTGKEADIHFLPHFLHTSTNEVGDLNDRLLSTSAFALCPDEAIASQDVRHTDH